MTASEWLLASATHTLSVVSAGDAVAMAQASAPLVRQIIIITTSISPVFRWLDDHQQVTEHGAGFRSLMLRLMNARVWRALDLARVFLIRIELPGASCF